MFKSDTIILPIFNVWNLILLIYISNKYLTPKTLWRWPNHYCIVHIQPPIHLWCMFEYLWVLLRGGPLEREYTRGGREHFPQWTAMHLREECAEYRRPLPDNRKSTWNQCVRFWSTPGCTFATQTQNLSRRLSRWWLLIIFQRCHQSFLLICRCFCPSSCQCK